MYLARELTGESLPAIGRAVRRARPHHRAARLPARLRRASPPTTPPREAVEKLCTDLGAPQPMSALRRARPRRLRDFRTGRSTAPSTAPAAIAHANATIHMSTAPTTSYSISDSRIMKLSLSTAELLTQLQTATRVASTRSAVQALSGVMISAQADCAPELLATDMEVGLRVPLDAEVARPGAAVLPARLLLDVARSLPAEQLTMELRSRRAGRRADLRRRPRSTCARCAPRTSRRCPRPSPETRVTLPAEAFVQTSRAWRARPRATRRARC